MKLQAWSAFHSRRTGTRAVIALLALTALTVLAGCNRNGATPPPAGISTTPATTATASPTPTGTPSPTPPPTDPAIVFAADGIGPYVIGTSLTDLQDHGSLANIEESPFCTDAKGADATGLYAGKITLTFRSGRLTAIHTLSTAYVTPSGARIGMSLTALQGIYGSRGTLINGSLSNKGYSVRVAATGLAIVFLLDSTNTKVAAMSGGEAQALEDAVRHGEGC